MAKQGILNHFEDGDVVGVVAGHVSKLPEGGLVSFGEVPWTTYGVLGFTQSANVFVYHLIYKKLTY